MSVSASFSICAYGCSVSIIARDAYATGIHIDPVFCMRKAPKPTNEESVETLIDASTLYKGKVDSLHEKECITLAESPYPSSVLAVVDS